MTKTQINALTKAFEAFIKARQSVRDAKAADTVEPFVALASALGEGMSPSDLAWLENDAASPLAALEKDDRIRQDALKAARIGKRAAELAEQAATLSAEGSGLAVKKPRAFGFLLGEVLKGQSVDAAVTLAKSKFAPTPEQVEAHNAAFALRQRVMDVVTNWLGNPDPRDPKGAPDAAKVAKARDAFLALLPEIKLN